MRISVLVIVIFCTTCVANGFNFNVALENEQLVLIDNGKITPIVSSAESIQSLPVPSDVSFIDMIWFVRGIGVAYTLDHQIISPDTGAASTILDVEYRYVISTFSCSKTFQQYF